MSLSETCLEHCVECQPSTMIRCLDLDVLAMTRNEGNDLHLRHTEEPEWQFLPVDLHTSASGAPSWFRKAWLWRIMLRHISLLCSVIMHHSEEGACIQCTLQWYQKRELKAGICKWCECPGVNSCNEPAGLRTSFPSMLAFFLRQAIQAFLHNQISCVR